MNFILTWAVQFGWSVSGRGEGSLKWKKAWDRLSSGRNCRIHVCSSRQLVICLPLHPTISLDDPVTAEDLSATHCRAVLIYKFCQFFFFIFFFIQKIFLNVSLNIFFQNYFVINVKENLFFKNKTWRFQFIVQIQNFFLNYYESLVNFFR